MDKLTVGNKIRLIKMDDDPCPIPAGATGTIQKINIVGLGAIVSVKWDAPYETRTLNLVYPVDHYEVIHV